MTEEKNIENSKETIDKKVTAGVSAFIFNEKGELLLTRLTRWNNFWVVPGGNIKYNESMKVALKRVIKEKTNLDIEDIKYLTAIELNKPKERPNLHTIKIEFLAKTKDEKTVKLQDEYGEFSWREPKEWLKDKDLYPTVKEVIEYYIDEFQEKKDFEHKYKRALADYQNLIKQTAKEKVEFVKYANESLLYEILPVYDNLKISLNHADEIADKNGWVEGIKHVIKQFKSVLDNLGVEEIKNRW